MRLEAAAATATPLPVWAASTSKTPLDLGIEWDAENRLQAVKQGGNTLASFTYDGKGRRTTKTASGVTTSYVYNAAQFLEERPNPGTTRRHVYGPGIDQALAQVVDGTATYNIADHLGSIVRTTDVVGNPTFTREYDPWGNLLQGSATSGYAFTGREWDQEIGLDYYRARFYDPRVGRFISEDPLRSRAGTNLYAYVDNAPLVKTDPSGEIPEWAKKAAQWGAAAAAAYSGYSWLKCSWRKEQCNRAVACDCSTKNPGGAPPQWPFPGSSGYVSCVSIGQLGCCEVIYQKCIGRGGWFGKAAMSVVTPTNCPPGYP